jgi:hypothetical protein
MMDNEELTRKKVRDAKELLVACINGHPEFSVSIWQNVILNVMFHCYASYETEFKWVEQDFLNALEHFRKHWDDIQKRTKEMIKEEHERHERHEIPKD